MTRSRSEHCSWPVATAMLLLIPTASLALFGQTSGTTIVTLRVIDRGADNAAVPGADVRVIDWEGKQIDQGITNAAGEFTVAPARTGQRITFEYGKLGYVKRPDRAYVDVKRTTKQVEGPLVRDDGDQTYYVKVAAFIQQASAAQPESERERFIERELERIRSLPQAAQTVVAANLPSESSGRDVACGKCDAGPRDRPPRQDVSSSSPGEVTGCITASADGKSFTLTEISPTGSATSSTSAPKTWTVMSSDDVDLSKYANHKVEITASSDNKGDMSDSPASSSAGATSGPRLHVKAIRSISSTCY